jgi:K+-transporting ATPase ATPase C chain
MLLLLTVITGFLYPFLISVYATLFVYEQSEGSIVYDHERPIGSLLIGQKFTKPEFFWPRPSACDYNAFPSGASNQGWTSNDLKKAVQDRIDSLQKTTNKTNIPADLVYASGSGIDPHISKEAAYFQIERIAKARNKDPQVIQKLIDQNVEKPLFGFLGSDYVNVLVLNQALEQLK